jgi:hypothetical protein
MKKYLALALPMVLLCACLEQEEENVEAKIKTFYTYYISVDAEKNSLGASQDSLKKYCTKEFLKRRTSNPDRSFDGVTFTENFSKDWVNTITVAKATERRDKIYRVSYLWDAKEKKSHNIVVTMGKEAGEWKIDDVRENE